jgi:hypothetical protein
VFLATFFKYCSRGLPTASFPDIAPSRMFTINSLCLIVCPIHEWRLFFKILSHANSLFGPSISVGDTNVTKTIPRVSFDIVTTVTKPTALSATEMLEFQQVPSNRSTTDAMLPITNGTSVYRVEFSFPFVSKSDVESVDKEQSCCRSLCRNRAKQGGVCGCLLPVRIPHRYPMSWTTLNSGFD